MIHPGINRRSLVLAGLTAVAGVAGCIRSPAEAVSTPDLAVSDIAQPEPTVDDLDRAGNEYTATVENTGISGTVRTELYFAARDATDQVLETSQQLQLEADEHATVTFTTDRPEWAEGFAIEAYGTRYVANIQNSGDAALVAVQLVDTATDTTVKETEITIPAETTKAVEFSTDHRFEEEHEVRASLIDW